MVDSSMMFMTCVQTQTFLYGTCDFQFVCISNDALCVCVCVCVCIYNFIILDINYCSTLVAFANKFNFLKFSFSKNKLL
jgi:hypothetical protein